LSLPAMQTAILVIGSLLGQAAGGGETAPRFAAADLEFFEKKVRPLLVQRCFECHGGGEEKRSKGGLVMATREELLAGGESGAAAVAGKPAESLLIEAIGYGGGIEMPPAGKLPAVEIAVLTEWVQRGLPFTPAEVTAAAKKTIDIAAGKKHWAFVPAVGQPLPEASGEVGEQKREVRGRIDAFVRAKLLEKGLIPSPEADRRVLARRLAFDLIGLPPAAEELAGFVADQSPDAYERLADRYLAAPHYGERWGRYWLDLARYCDVGESWREGEGQGWLYRDWVITALNVDVPYDQFVRKQLAADLMADAQPADNAALGFLGLSPTYWKELKLDHKLIKQVVAEEWEERIEALSATFLGLTAACARCHDHKFDPITQKDYYALAGVLASTKLDDRPVIASELAGPAKVARDKVKELQNEVDKLAATKELGGEDQRLLDELRQQIDAMKQTPHYDTPVAPGVSEASIAVLPDGEHRTKIEYQPGASRDVALHIRGSAANEGAVVPRRYLEVLSRDPPTTFQHGSGRLELAEAIVTDSRSLAARVMVNRVWQLHFGRGLVTSPSNFGTTGDRPSHPELFDDLAARFMARGWELKRLQREIVSSAAYRQASKAVQRSRFKVEGKPDLDPGKLNFEHSQSADPDNVYLWRMLPRRLDVEAWRDAMLVATGELNTAVGGPPEDMDKAESRRRTVYGKVHRRELNDLQRLHDFPDPISHSAGRIPTITPLAQLFALNSPFMQQRSTTLMQRLNREAPTDGEGRVRWLTEALFDRDPTAVEVASSREFVAAAQQDGASADEAWRQLCHVYLESNEFLFVD
jgi:mono/diheme cytochrome c family protein